MRRILIAALSLGALAATPARAQTIRGTVTDVATDARLGTVQISLIDADGAPVGAGTRSDSLGMFTVHAGRAGRFRIRAARIGYQPLVTDPIQLQLGQLVTIRVQMTTVALQLPTVRIVERRRLRASELMTTAGFDLRMTRGTGTFLDSSALARYGLLGADDAIRSLAANAVRIAGGPGDEALSMSNGCAPEILLDGLPLSSGSPVMMGQPGSMDDSTGRRQSALAAIAGYAANQIYGIEIYRFNQLPPASIGGLLGIGAMETRCGVVAVWTKNGKTREAMAPRTADGDAAIQVLRGTIVDDDTNAPVTRATITLLDVQDKPAGGPVTPDSTGEFIIRTTRAGSFRLQVAGVRSLPTLTPPIELAAEELVLVKLFVSAKHVVVSPLGILGRTSPRSFAPNTFTGFAYRRERAIAGTFLGPADVRARGVRTIGELLGGSGRDITVGRPRSEASKPGTEAAPACAPTWFLNGVLASSEVVETVRSTPSDQVRGVEIYDRLDDAPDFFAELVARECTIVGVWTAPKG